MSGEEYEKSLESVKVAAFDPLKVPFDDWYYTSFFHLIGAKNPRVYYLLRSDRGLPENAPVAVDPDNPTAEETKAIELYWRHQLELFSVLMLCLPKHLQHVASVGQEERPSGRTACDRLVRYYHENDPSYLPDLSYTIHNLSMADYGNHPETFMYQLDQKCAMLNGNADYMIPVQTRITILVRALKADSRFDSIIQEHTINPYQGEAGYERLKATIVSFARRFRAADSQDPADRPKHRREQTLALMERRRHGSKMANANGERLCWGCGKPGHIKANCPKERANLLQLV